MSGTKQTSKRKRRSKIAPALGAAGLSLSLASGGSAAAGPQAADAPTRNTIVSHEIILGEEEITDLSLATFYVFDNENTESTKHGVRQACGCWTGTYYTSGNDAYPLQFRPVRHAPAPKRVPKKL